MYKIVYYRTPRGEDPVYSFILSQGKRDKAKIFRHISLLKQMGPNLPRPYADHVKGKIRELRVKISRGHLRIFYFFFCKDFIVLLHSIVKKTRKIPEEAIDKSERNMEDFINRFDGGEFTL